MQTPDSSATPTNLTALDELIGSLVAGGFADMDDLRQHATDYFEEEEDVTEEQIDAVIQSRWQARLAEQATWTQESDFDRLSRAFDALGALGVVARMNFTCCQTCGHEEIDDERSQTIGGGFAEWGYAFFHQQDTESIVESNEVYLAYGSFGPVDGIDPTLFAAAEGGDTAAQEKVMEQSSVTVASTIVDALRAEGLSVTWDGTSARRIEVALPDWRKPLPA